MHPVVKSIFTLIILFSFTACSDNATITVSKVELKDVNCMKLVIFPPDKLVSETMQKLYKFDKNCSYRLSISQKNGIICNSNQNADKKILANFPSGYIRLDLIKDKKTIFSYYRDLTKRADEEDVKRAFNSLLDEITE